MYRNSIIIFITILLSGCFATKDMLRERGALPDNLYKVASDMVRIAGETCIKKTGYEDQPKDNWKDGRKLDTDDWVIRRFYNGSDNWFKAEASIQGIIDNIYFNNSSFQFVCGSHGWNSFSDSSKIIFTEYGIPSKSLKVVTIDSYDGMSKEDYCKIVGKVGATRYGGIQAPSGNRNLEDKCAGVEGETAISKFRGSLSQIKYDNDSALCEDLKYVLEFNLGKIDVDNDSKKISNAKINFGLRLMAASEVYEELSKYTDQAKVMEECRTNYFNK